MKNTARKYFVERVIPSYEIFVNYYNSREAGLRKDSFNAGNIAESLRDLPEHLFAEIGATSGFKNAYAFRKSISDINPSYKIVCDLANVIKHKEIDKNNPTFTSLEAIKEFIVIVRYNDLLGKYYRTRKFLEVSLLDGSVYEISDILHTSMILWSKTLITFGIIPAIPKLPELLPKFIKRNDERLKVEICISGIVGEYMEEGIRRLIYNKDKDSFIKPQKGNKFGTAIFPIKFNINKSPFVDIEAQNHK